MQKAKIATSVIMVLNIILLAALIFALIHVWRTPAQDNAVPSSLPSSQAEDAAEVMGGGNTELDAWIDNMKNLAQEHNVNAYFLQELFPEQIVYKFKGELIYADVDESLPMHTYNWANMTEDENGVLQYAEEGGHQGIFGIDVSKYQGPINWQKVKDAGVQYAFIRVGFRGYGSGEMALDEYFESYIQGASAVGIPVGVYFFSQAITTEEAVEEADYVLEAIAGYDVQYPVVFDMEEVETSPNRTEGLTAAQATDIALAFCNRVQEKGYHPMIYGNVSWFLSMMELGRLENYDKWFAQYRPMPWYPYDFSIWQYSHTGRVDGIEGDVDMNICFVDYAA